MSAFSRGCLFRHQCLLTPRPAINLVIPLKNHQLSRHLFSSTILRAIKKSQPLTPTKKAIRNNKPSLPSIKSSVSTPTSYQSYSQTLAQKSHATLLYQAPSHTLFIASSYSAALFCFSYAGFSFYTNYLDAPADLAAWVPIAFGGICFMMAAFGGWLLLGPARLIKTITAIPKPPTAPIPRGDVSARLKSAIGREPELRIEVELRKMFPVPFFPARKLDVAPEEFVLPCQLAPNPKSLSDEEVRWMRVQEEVRRRDALEYERSHIMTAPFRHMNRAFYNMFKAIGRTWSREGFLKVAVKGQMYKLDISGGWVLDRGKALDRLATVKPKL